MTEHRAGRTAGAGAGRNGGSASYPGAGLGLPETGPGAISGFGRRLGALIIDWLLCWVIAAAVTRSYFGTQVGTLAIFAVQDYALTALTGMTVGKRLLRIRVTRPDGRPAGLGWMAVRTLLLLAVVPPLLTDRDLRGLHDRAANTIVTQF